jgi:hypothetical protein
VQTHDRRRSCAVPIRGEVLAQYPGLDRINLRVVAAEISSRCTCTTKSASSPRRCLFMGGLPPLHTAHPEFELQRQEEGVR